MNALDDKKQTGQIMAGEAITWREEERDISTLKDNPRNPRTFTPEALAKLREAIEKVGYHHPLAINTDGIIISGHARRRVLTDMGRVKVRVTVPSRTLTEAEVKQMMIQANLHSGVFDNAVLSADFARQDLLQFGMPPTMMNDFDKQVRAGRTEPDALVAQQDTIITKRGDVWLLGDHRVMCGDSTSEADVLKATFEQPINLMVTDPPYGVNYDPTWRDNAGGQFGDGKTKMRGKVTADDRADWREVWRHFKGNIAFVWHGGLHSGVVAESLIATDFKLRAQIIWVKPHFIMSRGDYHWQHEPCWYAVREKGNWNSDRKQTTVWEIAGMNPAGRNRDEGNEKSTHGTQKPVECMRRPMEHCSKPGDLVFDPFLGSGSSIIAAQQSGRVCFGLEIDPAYVDMIVRRWQAFTGNKALRASDNEAFGE